MCGKNSLQFIYMGPYLPTILHRSRQLHNFNRWEDLDLLEFQFISHKLSFVVVHGPYLSGSNFFGSTGLVFVAENYYKFHFNRSLNTIRLVMLKKITIYSSYTNSLAVHDHYYCHCYKGLIHNIVAHHANGYNVHGWVFYN